MSSDRHSIRKRIVLLCAGVFTIGIAISMMVYPGGTWWTPSRTGHAFWQNFLCDLLHDPALNHQPNPAGAFFARVSMLTLIVGMGVFWSMPERWLRHGRIAQLVRSIGVLGTLPLAMVPLTPSNHFPKLHTAAVLLGGLPALFAFLLFGAALLRQKQRVTPLRALTALLGLLTILCLALYAQGAVWGGRTPRCLPALERWTVLLLLVWLFLMVCRGPAPSDTPNA